jgi:hypothetical protein
VTLYYYEGLTLAEIGQVLGVTESRICQMHTKAVLQLRGKLVRAAGLTRASACSPGAVTGSGPLTRAGLPGAFAC